MSHSFIFPIVIVLLLGWSMYRRVQRTVTFQVFRRGRLRTQMILFIVIGLLYLSTLYIQPFHAAYDAVGLVVGVVVAWFAGRDVAFKTVKDRLVYRVNPWVGSIMMVLFIARIIMRITLLTHGSANSAQSASDPWTGAFLYMLLGYYIFLNTVLIRRGSKLEGPDGDVAPPSYLTEDPLNPREDEHY